MKHLNSSIVVLLVLFFAQYAIAARQAIARFDMVPEQVISVPTKVGVVAFHKDGIASVGFSITDGTNTEVDTITSATLNDRTGVVEYWTTIDPSDFDDTEITVTATVTPNTYPAEARVITLELWANSGGTYSSAPAYYVHPTQGSDTTGNGTELSPYQTIRQAVYALDDLDQGEVVLMAAGTYLLADSFNQNYTPRYPERWITIRATEWLDKHDVILTMDDREDNWRPYIGNLHLRNVSLDFAKIPMVYASSVWLDNSRIFNSDGWAAEYDIGSNFYGGIYVTDSVSEDMLYGFQKCILARNIVVRRTSGDALQNSECIINAEVTRIDGTIKTHHADLYQMFGEMDNVIIYGLTAKRLVDTQGFFLEPTYNSVSGPTYTLSNAAFIDITVDHIPTTPGFGGPPYSQLMSSFEHVIFDNVHLPGQRFILRDDVGAGYQVFAASDVIFNDCTIHHSSYDKYVDTEHEDYEGLPTGVTMTNTTRGDELYDAPSDFSFDQTGNTVFEQTGTTTFTQ